MTKEKIEEISEKFNEVDALLEEVDFTVAESDKLREKERFYLWNEVAFCLMCFVFIFSSSYFKNIGDISTGLFLIICWAISFTMMLYNFTMQIITTRKTISKLKESNTILDKADELFNKNRDYYHSFSC